MDIIRLYEWSHTWSPSVSFINCKARRPASTKRFSSAWSIWNRSRCVMQFSTTSKIWQKTKYGIYESLQPLNMQACYRFEKISFVHDVQKQEISWWFTTRLGQGQTTVCSVHGHVQRILQYKEVIYHIIYIHMYCSHVCHSSMLKGQSRMMAQLED